MTISFKNSRFDDDKFYKETDVGFESPSGGTASLPSAGATGKKPEFTKVKNSVGIDFSSIGNLESTKYLYELGLQDIFNSYKQNIETLSQKEQSELQDAYYIRKMSEKYLGEYASNNNIGNVSGDLLQIFANYQDNISEIGKHYDELELNLTQEFQKERLSQMQNILQTQYNMDMEKLDLSSQEVLYNIAMGNTGEMTDMEYLKLAYENNQISREAFMSGMLSLQEEERITNANQVMTDIRTGNTNELSNVAYLEKALENELIDQEFFNENIVALYDENYNMILENISNGTLGFTENGDIEESSMAYLEANKNLISQAQYEDLKYKIQYAETLNKELSDVLETKPISPSEMEDVNPVFDFGGANVDMNSTVAWEDSQGNRFFTVYENADVDPQYPISGEELTEEWLSQPNNEGLRPIDGDMVALTVNGTETTYRLVNNKWHRVVQQQPIESTMKLWNFSEGDFNEENVNYSFDKRSGKNDIFTFNGIEYQQEKNTKFKYDWNSLDEEQKEIYNVMEATHGEGGNLQDNSIVIYQGKVYIYQDGYIYEMIKKE